MLVNRADSHTSGARFVRCNGTEDSLAEKRHHRQLTEIFTHNLIFGNWQKAWLIKTPNIKNLDQPKQNWLKDLLVEWKLYFARTPNNQKPTLTDQNEIDSKTCWPTANYFYQNLCRRRCADFANLQNQLRTKPKKRTFAKLTWPKETPNNHKPKLTRTLTNGKTKIEKTKLNLESR